MHRVSFDDVMTRWAAGGQVVEHDGIVEIAAEREIAEESTAPTAKPKGAPKT